MRVLHRSFLTAFFALLFAGLAIPQSVQALPFDPLAAGLNEGDQFRLAFVTAGRVAARDDSIAGYNRFVQSQADIGSLTGDLGLTWTVIGSTSSVDARDNTDTNPSVETGVSIFTLTGLRIAEDNADLWDGSIENPIATDPNGLNRNARVWTGTRTNGSVDSFQLGDSSFSPISRFGRSGSSDSGWISTATETTASLNRLYALSETLTVSPTTEAPEPSAMALFGVGLVGFAWVRRRRQRI